MFAALDKADLVHRESAACVRRAWNHGACNARMWRSARNRMNADADGLERFRLFRWDGGAWRLRDGGPALARAEVRAQPACRRTGGAAGPAADRALAAVPRYRHTQASHERCEAMLAERPRRQRRPRCRRRPTLPTLLMAIWSRVGLWPARTRLTNVARQQRTVRPT